MDKISDPTHEKFLRSCDNPNCDERFSRSIGRGRPRTFHSNECRTATLKDVKRLAAELAALRLRKAAAKSKQKGPIEAEINELRWALSAYLPSVLDAALGADDMRAMQTDQHTEPSREAELPDWLVEGQHVRHITEGVGVIRHFEVLFNEPTVCIELESGRRISIPIDPDMRQLKPVERYASAQDLVATRRGRGAWYEHIVVAEGDTLSALAQEHFGDPNRGMQIGKLNGIRSNSELRSGQLLKLPVAGF